MHFKLSRASSYFASSIRHPASILPFILNLHTGDLQCEDIVLGSDLDSVRHCIADGLVVFHPCCSQSRQFHFSSARKDGIFSSWKKRGNEKVRISRIYLVSSTFRLTVAELALDLFGKG